MTNEIFKQYGNDPIALYKSWLDEAQKTEQNDPDAVCLATADTQGRPSARMVLIKEISESGLKFHTNAESRKGVELHENPYAALCIHWKSLRRQIRVEGLVEAVSEEESDEYFSSRPTERQIGAWASKQSQPYETLQDMADAVKKYESEFDGKDIPRPPYWKGYRLIPTALEFWIGHKDRLHTRFVYTREDGGEDKNEWRATWLCP